MTIFRKNNLTMGSPSGSTMSNNKKSTFKSVDNKQVKFKLSASKKNKDDTIIIAVATTNDTDIQPTDKKRRYMRRGSRAPSMMTISQNEIDHLVELDEQQQQQLSIGDETTSYHNQQLMQQFQSQSQQRRMSVMTSLKSNFERVTIIESTVKQIRRRISLVETPSTVTRRFSLELVRICD